jgi:hypothetical protein
MQIYKLGKNEKKVKLKTLQIHDFMNLSVMPAPPAAFDWSMVRGKPLFYGMDGNDKYGDCPFVSACHQIGTWTGNTGIEQVATEKDALDAYGRFVGFDPTKPETDNGANMLDTATRWRIEPIFNRKIAAFASVDLKRLDLVASAMFAFGGLWIGWRLPKAWQGADVWDISPTGSTEGDWKPNSWGGHATHGPALSPKLMGVETWQKHMPVTVPAFEAYADEGYVLISTDTWACLTGNDCPAGVDGAALQAALAQIIV